MDENNVIEKVDGEVVSEPKIVEVNTHNAKKFASVRFYMKDIVIYRFDLWTTSNGKGPELDENGNKLVELRNLINNFNEIRPESPRKVKDFFATVGLIRFMFPKTKFPISAQDKEESIIITLENEISNNIKMAKLRGLRVEINPESE